MLLRKKILLGLSFLSFLISSCSPVPESKPEEALSPPAAQYGLDISFLDVGKADAIILYTNGHTALIDCGNKGDGKLIVQKLEEKNITNIDYLFITHFDKDHVGGARKVINNIPIGTIVTPRYNGGNSEYREYSECIAEKGIKPVQLTEKMSFILDDCLFEVYPPKKSSYKNPDNDFSLVISVTHGDNRLLFTGDAEEERLSELNSQIDDLSYSFLKVPHHGNYNSYIKSFLINVSPEFAVITCSAEEPADQRVTDVLDHLGTNTYLTQNGEITLTSNGKNINIFQN